MPRAYHARVTKRRSTGQADTGRAYHAMPCSAARAQVGCNFTGGKRSGATGEPVTVDEGHVDLKQSFL